MLTHVCCLNRSSCAYGKIYALAQFEQSLTHTALLQLSYRYENARRDRTYGRIVDANATVDTRELADKVRDLF